MTNVRVVGWCLSGVGIALGCSGRLDVGKVGTSPGIHASATGGEGGDAEAIGGRGGQIGGAPGAAGRQARSGGVGGKPDVSVAGGAGDDDTGPVAGAAGEESSAGGAAGATGAAGAGGDGDAGCQCASSTALTLLSCSEGALFAPRLLNHDGSVALFGRDPGSLSRETRRWQDGKLRSVKGAYPVALSTQGATALLEEPGGYYLWHDDESQERVPFTAWLLSADGTIAVGWAETSPGIYSVVRGTSGGTEAFDIPRAKPDGFPAHPLTMNASATMIAGRYFDGSGTSGDGGQPFIWSEGQLRLLGALPGAPVASRPRGGAYAMSDNGASVAGFTVVGEGVHWLFRWTEAEGMVPIGHCYSSDNDNCSGLEIDSGLVFSADGTVLAGTIDDVGLGRRGLAFRWTQSNGVVLLDPERLGAVRGMSTDGSVVLANVLDEDTLVATVPFIWDTTHGTRDLAAALEAAGTDTTGWALGEATALSRDGNVVLGSGTCDGAPALYRAVVPD